jgi:two-component system response regulator QseB
MGTKNIIVIEDDVLLAQQMKTILVMQDLNVEVFHSTEEYLMNSKAAPLAPQIYLLDLNLPGLTGAELVKVIRYKDKVSPIFMISGSTEDHILNKCLAAGADDYLLKPYNPDHLMLKIKNAQTKLRYFLGANIDFGIKLVPEARVISNDGEKLQLTNREFAIIELLISEPGAVHSREDLVKKIGNEEVTMRSIDVHVSSLRKKIERLNIGIETMRGVGYKIILPLLA